MVLIIAEDKNQAHLSVGEVWVGPVPRRWVLQVPLDRPCLQDGPEQLISTKVHIHKGEALSSYLAHAVLGRYWSRMVYYCITGIDDVAEEPARLLPTLCLQPNSGSAYMESMCSTPLGSRVSGNVSGP